ncbi:hypothetical protein GCM10028801_26320 [Nocardioides maradonensis]
MLLSAIGYPQCCDGTHESEGDSRTIRRARAGIPVVTSHSDGGLPLWTLTIGFIASDGSRRVRL